jgi:hypothetical protein
LPESSNRMTRVSPVRLPQMLSTIAPPAEDGKVPTPQASLPTEVEGRSALPSGPRVQKYHRSMGAPAPFHSQAVRARSPQAAGADAPQCYRFCGGIALIAAAKRA